MRSHAGDLELTMSVEPLIVSYSDKYSNGACRAAWRLHCAFLQQGYTSTMKVALKTTDDPHVHGPDTRISKIKSLLRKELDKKIGFLQNNKNDSMRHFGVMPSNMTNKINRERADIVNLHWISNETLSIEDVSRIKKPILWTFHDLWPFCGAEHFVDERNARFRVGYNKFNRPEGARGIDLDRWVWKRKWRTWKQPMHIVAPSEWLADCIRSSALMGDWPVHVIPNTLDTTIYRPIDQQSAKKMLGLPFDKNIILFGAIGGTRQKKKGFSYLEKALRKLYARNGENRVVCAIFGQSKPEKEPDVRFPIYWLGHAYDDCTLSVIYNAADVMVNPSVFESFGQTASEALACGTPVVAFNYSGLAEIVSHKKSGYLANPFDANDLADGIEWVLENMRLGEKLPSNSRARALALWDPEVIVSAYKEVYEQVLSEY